MPDADSPSTTTTRGCIYCGEIKSEDQFSDEHIWPDALGGDFLPAFWRTEDVCGRCNSVSGVFVDGAFIKSFFVSGERSHDALAYLDPAQMHGVLPLNYLGTIQNIPTQDGDAADFWVCAPGANIVHFRSIGEEDLWRAYAGGDPRRASKASKAGRVLMAVTSAEPYWICVALASVRHHFAKAEKFITNIELPADAKHFHALDPGNAQHAADRAFFDQIAAMRLRGERLHAQAQVNLAADSRFLAKLALGIGYKLFGDEFLASEGGVELRRAFREANSDRRRQLRVRGSGYLRGVDLAGLNEDLRWPGGWLLVLRRHPTSLSLSISPPSGRVMVIQVTDEACLLDRLDATYRDGVAWLTVPEAQRAIGPIGFPDYVAYKLAGRPHAELGALDALRGDPSRLPPTGIEDPREDAE